MRLLEVKRTNWVFGFGFLVFGFQLLLLTRLTKTQDQQPKANARTCQPLRSERIFPALIP